MDHLNQGTVVRHDVTQGTDAWFDARRGTITASIVGKLITPSTLAPAHNDTSRGILAGLVAESITGRSDHFETWQMARGTADEPHAVDLYATHRAPVEHGGYWTRTYEDMVIGASPDGLVGDDGIIECKSRGPHIQIQHIVDGKVPIMVMPQIQAQLLVTGRAWCDYVSYSQGLKLSIIRVEADQDWQTAIYAACETAYAEMRGLFSQYLECSAGMPYAPIRPDEMEIKF